MPAPITSPVFATPPRPTVEQAVATIAAVVELCIDLAPSVDALNANLKENREPIGLIEVYRKDLWNVLAARAKSRRQTLQRGKT